MSESASFEFFPLSEWLTLANVMLTAVFAGLTFFILRANRAAVRAMREQMTEQARPYIHVAVQVRLGTPILQLAIRNVGRSPAQGLRLRLDRDFYQFGDRQSAKNLASQTAFTQPIDCLPPGTELLFDLDSGITIFATHADRAETPLTFLVSAEYRYGNSTYSEETHVDLRPFMGTSIPRHPVVEELERVRQSIEKLTNVINQSAAARPSTEAKKKDEHPVQQ